MDIPLMERVQIQAQVLVPFLASTAGVAKTIGKSERFVAQRAHRARPSPLAARRRSTWCTTALAVVMTAK